MLAKIKKYYNILKSYFYYLSDFKKLNNYIYLSNIFLNRVEQLLSSDLSDNVILDNIKISYSSFKTDYEIEDFSSGVSVQNNFERKNNNE